MPAMRTIGTCPPFPSLKDALTTSAWKPFRWASKSFARNMAKPSIVAFAIGMRSQTTQSIVFEEQVRASSVAGPFSGNVACWPDGEIITAGTNVGCLR